MTMIPGKSYYQFVEFCDKKGIKLIGWQYRFAEGFLDDAEQLLVMRPSASGKTFIVDLLKEYLEQ